MDRALAVHSSGKSWDRGGSLIYCGIFIDNTVLLCMARVSSVAGFSCYPATVLY